MMAVVGVDVLFGMKRFYFPVLIIALTIFCDQGSADDSFGTGQYEPQFGTAKTLDKRRYLLYDVNPGEGFNLRRDVYIRVANLVKFLNKEPDQDWMLVLPPWGRLYHWKTRTIDQIRVPWKRFFDLPSLAEHVPVMEYDDYIKEVGEPLIEEVYYLQGYKEGWTDGKWDEKTDFRDCIEQHGYHQDSEGYYRGWFWGYDETRSPYFQCFSVQAAAVFMKDFLMKETSARSIAFLRAERLIHGTYSEWSSEWWTARRSMRFAAHLRKLGDEFRANYLSSDDEKDKTVLDSSWTTMKRQHGDARGGPYLAIHWRRADFLYAHGKDIPDVRGTADQLIKLLKEYDLDTVFVATDAPNEEFVELKNYLKDYKVERFTYSHELLDELKDGGIAIIDQYICAHARVFIGSYVSTFSFRIQEEREILGFSQEDTFRRLCPDPEKDCEQPTKWGVQY